MPKKMKFTREAVIEAGLKQLAENGWEGLTPKSVAQRLGASTMPIFSHFSSMDELREAIIRQAWEILKKYVSQNYTGDAWVDQSVGYVFLPEIMGGFSVACIMGLPERCVIADTASGLIYPGDSKAIHLSRASTKRMSVGFGTCVLF